MRRTQLMVGIGVAVVLATGGYSVAQQGDGFSDPAVPGTVDPVLRESAVSAIAEMTFPESPRVAELPWVGQLTSGTPTALVEVAPGIWYGPKRPYRGTTDGFYLLRRDSTGTFVSIPGPAGETLTLAGFDGEHLIVLTEKTSYSTPAGPARNGVTAWTKAVEGLWNPAMDPAGLSLDTPDIFGSSRLSCRGSVCARNLDGFLLSADGSQAEKSDGHNLAWLRAVDLGVLKSEYGLSGGTGVGPNGIVNLAGDETEYVYATTPEISEDIARAPIPKAIVGSPQWSQTQQTFLAVAKDGSLLSLGLTGQVGQVDGPLPGRVAVVQTDDSALVTMHETATGLVVHRDGVQVATVPPLPTGIPFTSIGFKPAFGPYAGGTFIAINDADLPSRTLLTSYDAGQTWSPAPTPGVVTPPPTTTTTTSTTSTVVTTTTTTVPAGLYRVRNGDTARGEIALRIYVERNVAAAALGDYDPDGDGWSMVGRSNGDGDNGPIARSWLDGGGLPQVSTRHAQKGCLWLTPVSLSKVSIGQTRLLSTVGLNTAQCRAEAPSADVDGDGVADNAQPLYRARNGDPARGELAARVYIERNINASEAQIGVSDYDPDGDGWALVGRTNGAGDNGTFASLSLAAPTPTARVNHPTKGCITIVPSSIDLVARGQTRLVTITSTSSGTC